MKGLLLTVLIALPIDAEYQIDREESRAPEACVTIARSRRTLMTA